MTNENQGSMAVWTTIISGTLGIAGAVAAAFLSWWLNIFSPSPAPAPNVSANVVQVGHAETKTVVQQVAESPIAFADWQAMVRESFNVQQRRELFGGDIGKRVTWEGLFDQFNLIQRSPSRDDSYILVMFEDAAALQGVGGLKPAPALCHFPADAKRRLAQLRHGQRIVVTGTLTNPGMTGQLMGTELRQCKLLSPAGEE